MVWKSKGSYKGSHTKVREAVAVAGDWGPPLE